MANKRLSFRCIVPVIFLLAPLSGEAQVPFPAKYDFPDVQQETRLESVGSERGASNRGGITGFRRSFYVDNQSFVIQKQDNRRYYLLILSTPHDFKGSCARRPEAIRRQGGTYFLICGPRAISIARIYLFDDRDQMEEVTSRIAPEAADGR